MFENDLGEVYTGNFNIESFYAAGLGHLGISCE